MKPKLSPTQETVLRIIASGKGRPRSFEGPQLRAAGALLNRELIGRKGPSLGYTLTKAGEDYAREAGWLEVPAGEDCAREAELEVTAPAPEVTPSQVLGHQVKEQHRRTLRCAEELLREVTQLVERLRADAVPAIALHPYTSAFLIADHAKLLALHEMLEVVEKGDKAKA